MSEGPKDAWFTDGAVAKLAEVKDAAGVRAVHSIVTYLLNKGAPIGVVGLLACRVEKMRGARDLNPEFLKAAMTAIATVMPE